MLNWSKSLIHTACSSKMQCNVENAWENWTWQLGLKDELEVQSIEHGPEHDDDEALLPEVIVYYFIRSSNFIA